MNPIDLISHPIRLVKYSLVSSVSGRANAACIAGGWVVDKARGAMPNDLDLFITIPAYIYDMTKVQTTEYLSVQLDSTGESKVLSLYLSDKPPPFNVSDECLLLYGNAGGGASELGAIEDFKSFKQSDEGPHPLGVPLNVVLLREEGHSKRNTDNPMTPMLPKWTGLLYSFPAYVTKAAIFKDFTYDAIRLVHHCSWDPSSMRTGVRKDAPKKYREKLLKKGYTLVETGVVSADAWKELLLGEENV